MSNRSRTGALLVLGMLVLVLLIACTRAGGTVTPAAPLSATLNEVTGHVDAKQPSQTEYSPTQSGHVIHSGAQVQTGDDGRVRVDLSSGTFFRAGPSSHFTIEDLNENDGDPFTKLKLETGKVWIILTTGSVEVEMPTGVATVRGSYLSVETQDDHIKITCLEGDCSLENEAGEVNLIAGQAAVVVNATTPPTSGTMTEEDFEAWLDVNPEAEVIIPAVTATQGAIPPTATPTPQPFSTPSSLGPQKSDFPANYNPLTGLPVENPELFEYPALLMSVSHFPPVARPQAGLSFAPWVFEFYITEGATRFLAVFHGDFPEPEIPVSGDCDIRTSVFRQTDEILGNQVWLDENKNGRQDAYEPGVGGVCIKLYDEAGELVQQTTTDTNGYYGFNLESDGEYTVEFILPEWLQFTDQNVGDENADSDADQLSGRADALVDSTVLYLDAGVILLEELVPTANESTQLPKAEVGPIRSGRLIHADMAAFFQSSCLIYAFASEEVLAQLPQCAFVAHEDAGGGSMMSLQRMEAVAKDNMGHTRKGFDYSSNLFSEQAPEGGVPADQVNVYVAYLNQSGWIYDPLYGSWLRYVDNADQKTAGELHADTDRLTGRQLDFENFIVIYVEHDVISPTNLDIHLEQGDQGYAFLFRDGMKYDIRWSTISGEYEQKSGQRRPMQFLNADGTPAELKPGRTWIFVATPYSSLTEESDGVWRLRYYPPEGAK
jgi:hypothetical protein